jgi:CBS domain-containing protein
MVLYAKDIVERDVVSMPRDMNALAAARTMRDRRHGYIIVVSPDGKPEGIVTEWDYLSKVVAEGRDVSSMRLADLMSGNLVTVSADEGIERVAEVMTQRGIRRVLVVQDGKVLGIIEAKQILARLKEYVDRISAAIARAQTPMFG